MGVRVGGVTAPLNVVFWCILCGGVAWRGVILGSDDLYILGVGLVRAGARVSL